MKSSVAGVRSMLSGSSTLTQVTLRRMGTLYSQDLYDYDGNYTQFEEFNFNKANHTLPFASYMIAWVVIWIGFPLTILAIYALYSLIQENNIAPIFVINLLISDLIQMCCFVIWVAIPKSGNVLYVSTCVYYIGVLASVGFMVCIAMERYMLIAFPIRYRFRQSIKLCVLISITVWTVSLIEFLLAVHLSKLPSLILRSILLLLPFPLLIFFLAGTLKALSAAIALHRKEKQRIIGILVLVVFNYTVLFLPWVIWLMELVTTSEQSLHDPDLYLSFLQFSPLADLVLYVFMRRGVIDNLLDHLCCCCRQTEEENDQVTITDRENSAKNSAQ